MSGDFFDERLRFVKHKGQAIFVIDFSHCTKEELLLLLEDVRAQITRHDKDSLLTLADFTGAQVDKNVATRIKEVLTLDRPFVKRSALVGADSIPHIFYEHFKSFSRREIPAFATREEAMDWLVQETGRD